MSKKSKNDPKDDLVVKPQKVEVIEVSSTKVLNKKEAKKQKDPDKGSDDDIAYENPEFDPDALLPTLSKDKTPAISTKDRDPLAIYLRDISRYDLLSPEQEKALTTAFVKTGDIEIAKKLVQANLRLVVKIAMEYRKAYKNVMDLIQEGNIGLMKAVSKYDPTKGAKLSYYSSWWIRSYILKFILDNFRLIKVGTTREQKKLFFNLLKEKQRLSGMGIEPTTKLIAENLGVSEKSVTIMNERIGAGSGEVNIDGPAFKDNARMTLGEVIESQDEPFEDKIERDQGTEILKDHLHDFLGTLKERDLDIFKKRLLSEVPPSLQSIADQYGVSRERIRQVEERLLKKLKVYMADFIR